MLIGELFDDESRCKLRTGLPKNHEVCQHTNASMHILYDTHRTDL